MTGQATREVDDPPHGTALVWAVAVVLMLAAVIVVVVRVQPAAPQPIFDDGGNSSGGPVPIGQMLYSLVVQSTSTDGPRSVQLFGVAPHVVDNTADATLTVLSCTLNGTITTDVAPDLDYCDDATPFVAGHTYRFDPEHDGAVLLLAITPKRAGSITIDGLDVAYLRDGDLVHQNTGFRMEYTAR